MNHSKDSRTGFTLIELLVCLGIISILMSLILPAVQSARQAAHRTSCRNNLRQIALGVSLFESSFRKFPAGVNAPDHSRKPSLSWLAQILPYIEESALWEQSKFEFEVHRSPFQHATLQSPVVLYQCPSRPGSSNGVNFTRGNRLVATTDYMGVNGTSHSQRDGVLFMDSAVRTRDVTDGLSQTLLCGERPPSPDFWFGWWYAGYGLGGGSGAADMTLGTAEINESIDPALKNCGHGPWRFQSPENRTDMCSSLHYWSHHTGGANFAFCDGSVKFISYKQNGVLGKMASRAGAEP